jgi:carbonic anhydrase
MPEIINRLIAGFQNFRATHIDGSSSDFERLVREGQAPQVLVVACSDSRNDPAILTESAPGDLFVVRNVAAIVPPYIADRNLKGTSSAIEFAVKGLKVRHIIVLGHALCGGVRALDADNAREEGFEFLTDWVGVAHEAREAISGALRDVDPELRRRALEQATILISLRNLLTFPWIEAAVRGRTLQLHGWYFDMVRGDLLAHDTQSGLFRPVEALPPSLCTAQAPCAPGCICVGRLDFAPLIRTAKLDHDKQESARRSALA